MSRSIFNIGRLNSGFDDTNNPFKYIRLCGSKVETFRAFFPFFCISIFVDSLLFADYFLFGFYAYAFLRSALGLIGYLSFFKGLRSNKNNLFIFHIFNQFIDITGAFFILAFYVLAGTSCIDKTGHAVACEYDLGDYLTIFIQIGVIPFKFIFVNIMMHVSKFYNWQNLNNGSVTASYSVSRNNNNVYPNPPPNNFNFGSERPPLPTYNEAGSLPEKVKPVNFDAPSLPNITITQNNLQTVNAISGAIIQPEDIPPPAFESVVQLNFDAPPEQTNHNILPNNSAINHTNDTLNWLATNAENSHPQIIEEPEEPTFIPPQPLKPIIYWDHEMINNGIVDMQTQKQPDEDIYQSTYADFSTINTQASSSSHDPDVADWDAHTDIPTSPHVKTPPSSMKTNLTNNPTNFIFVSNDHINFDDEPTPPNSSFVGIPLDSGVKTQDLYTLTTEDDKTSNV